MRYAVISDVHSNLEALQVVLEDLAEEKVDALLCAGDMVGYGADPEPCLRLLRAKVHQMVCGNHDLAVAGQFDLNWFNRHAQSAVLWTRGALSLADRDYLKSLPLVWKDSQVTLVHGSLHEPEKFHYVLDLETARASLEIQETPVAFIGHTHVPGVFLKGDSGITFLRPPSMRLDPRQKVLVNAGSVGQPRDGDLRASWCLYDSEMHTLEIRRVGYPIAQAQAKIRAAGLPEFLAERLALGY